MLSIKRFDIISLTVNLLESCYLLSEVLSAGFLRDDELTLLVSSCLTQICS